MFTPTTQHTIKYLYQFSAESGHTNQLHKFGMVKLLATVHGDISIGEWGREASK